MILIVWQRDFGYRTPRQGFVGKPGADFLIAYGYQILIPGVALNQLRPGVEQRLCRFANGGVALPRLAQQPLAGPQLLALARQLYLLLDHLMIIAHGRGNIGQVAYPRWRHNLA